MQLLLNFLLTTGIISLFILTYLLFKRKGRTLARQILALIFLLLLFVIAFSYGEINGVPWLIWTGFLVTDTIGFLVGPLLFFYVTALFKPELLSPKQIILHLIPAFFYLVFISIPFLISMTTGRYINSLLEFLDLNSFVLHFQACYLIFYCILSLNILSKYHSISKTYYSNLKKTDIKWIRYLLYGIIVLMMLHLSFTLFSQDINFKWISDDQVITLALIILIVYLAYYGTQQSQILLPDYLDYKEISLQKKPSKTSTHHLANASAEEVTQLKHRLHEVLQNQKPYKDENLNLISLALLLPTTDRKLSALLNHYMYTSFYDLINSYRVQEVKEKMTHSDYKKYTLLAIAYEAGFNSKSSFNRIFKKETGVSPSTYKKNLNIKK